MLIDFSLAKISASIILISSIFTGLISLCLLFAATSKLLFSHLWKKNSSHDRHRMHSKNHPMEKEKALGENLTFADIVDEVAGVYPKIMHEGTMEAGAWSCGMVAGLVNDIPTVEELINRIMSEANNIIDQKLKVLA